MFIATETIHKVLRHILAEGAVLVEDTSRGDHPVLKVPNLQVMQIMRSLNSKGMINRVFNWRHAYCYLTNEGVSRLRAKFNMPESVMSTSQAYEAPSAEMDAEKSKGN
jgi:small subunit ribosomal protein S10e